jgi:hypothetical protein
MMIKCSLCGGNSSLTNSIIKSLQRAFQITTELKFCSKELVEHRRKLYKKELENIYWTLHRCCQEIEKKDLYVKEEEQSENIRPSEPI